uniref:Transcriptional regulator, TetR family n=1 Tax=Solibacter usitatus (strain Ellin6076) TaxID=234267 RepID=Q022K4_SOLUE
MNSQSSQHSANTPSLQIRKQQLVRDAIWDAATDLFAVKGFDETTVEDIAEAAGVSRRSFFRYFASKNDLMAHGMVNYGAELTAAIEACPEKDSLAEVFRKTVLQVARKSAANPRARIILAIVTKYPAAREAELSRFAEVQDLVAKAFARRCRKRGETELTARLLAGLTLQVTGVTVRWWFEQGEPEIQSAVDDALATLEHLICRRRK